MLLCGAASARAATGAAPVEAVHDRAVPGDDAIVSGASFSPDETQILFSSDATGIFNVHAVPTAGGAPSR